MPSTTLDILTLRLFCHLAGVRSFSRTAEDHGLTQPAVSQRIRQLEARLDVRLVDRSVRPFVLTQAGELLVREGRQLIDAVDDLVRRVRASESSSAALEGEVRVDAIYSAGIGLLSSLSEDFRATHPEVSVVLDYKRPEQVADSVRAGGCDFGIISYPRSWRDVRVTPLRDEPMGVVCRSDHRLATRRKLRARDLERWSLVGFDPTLPVARDIRRYLRANGLEPRPGAVVDNVDTMKMLVAETQQIAILPLRTVQKEVEGGVLHAIELEPPLARPMAIIQARGSRLKAAARSLADFLLEHAGPASVSEPFLSRVAS